MPPRGGGTGTACRVRSRGASGRTRRGGGAAACRDRRGGGGGGGGGRGRRRPPRLFWGGPPPQEHVEAGLVDRHRVLLDNYLRRRRNVLRPLGSRPLPRRRGQHP